MPLPQITVTKTKKAQNWALGSVFVDASGPMEVLGKVENAVKPDSLMFFLMGMVSPYYEDQIVDRFAGLGDSGVPGGTWAPLEESTIRIRHQLGYFDDYAINERTGALLRWLMESRQFNRLPLGAEMSIPGEDGDSELVKKLKVAQEGWVQGPGEMIPGAVTPPRPVLAMDAVDLIAITKMLQNYVMAFVGNSLSSIGDTL